jgi:hypothetical protein
MGETAKGVARGGILGSLGGLVTGAVVGAVAGLANPLGIALAIGGGIAMATGVLPVVGAVAAFALPALGAATGALTGLGIGTGIGVGWFGVKGALAGSSKADDQQALYNQHKQAAMDARANATGQVRAQAAEQYTAVGYQAGFEEGANYVVNQIIQAQQAQMAAGGGQQSFVEKHAPKKQHDSHAQAVRDSQAAAAGHDHVVG